MKKNWFYIFSIFLSGALLVTGIVFLFVINYNLSIPEEVEIFASNDTTYLKTSLNSNDYGYIYKFKSEKDDVIYPSKANMLNLDILINEKVISLGEEYDISVCYKSEYENGYSKFSKPVSWLASQYLQAPTIAVNSYAIYWEAVENADSYDIIYTSGSEELVYTTTATSVPLSKLAGGKHYLNVVAKSSQRKYMTSSYSNSVYKETYHEVEAFSSATFDRQTKILTILSSDDVNKVRLWAGDNEYYMDYYDFSYSGRDYFKKVKTGSGFQFEIDLSLVYNATMTYMSVEPIVDGYNVFNGLPVSISVK